MVLYLIRTQSGEFLGKHLDWVTLTDPGSLFQTPHKDVALNQLVELNTRDVRLRAAVIPCTCDVRGRPDLDTLATATC